MGSEMCIRDSYRGVSNDDVKLQIHRRNTRTTKVRDMLTRNPDTAKTCTKCGKLIDESWFKHSEKFCPQCYGNAYEKGEVLK